MGGAERAKLRCFSFARLGGCCESSAAASGAPSSGSGFASCGSRPRAATVATVAATTSRPTSAALDAVVSTSPEPMTGQGQSAAGSAAWSAMFRHVRYENLVAGVSGGVLSNLALHPLDLVKIRFAGKSLSTPRVASLH